MGFAYEELVSTAQQVGHHTALLISMALGAFALGVHRASRLSD